MSYLRIIGIFGVFLSATVAWMVLSGVTRSRGNAQTEKLRSSVQSLWGNAQVQVAPELTFHFVTEELATATEIQDGKEVTVQEIVKHDHSLPMPIASSDIDVDLHSDLRRKGLAWYSLYDVKFQALYGYVHQAKESGVLEVALTFPDANAIYDDFQLVVSGVESSQELETNAGVVRTKVNVKPGSRVEIRARYKSRGIDSWQYVPSRGVGRLERFALRMHTDFSDIDFPAGTLSPSHRQAGQGGWRLSWNFAQIVTGNGIGMITPQRVQPGELATELATSAPISLFLFFFVVFVLATLREIDIHPINYALIAGAFFAFHLLFAYSVDHLSVEQAFALSSAVSVFLVVSYLRLVVSARFAYVEAGLAQLVYLVGFSLAHFWEGFTGLTATVLSIITLYALMQLTGRVRWSSVFAPRAVRDRSAAPA